MKREYWRSDSLAFVKATILTLHCPPCNVAIMNGLTLNKLGLLIGASFAVDTLAAVWWLTAQPDPGNSRYSVAVLTALTLGQVGVVAIWLAFRPRHDAWSYIVPIAALGIAAWIRLKLSTFDDFSLWITPVVRPCKCWGLYSVFGSFSSQSGDGFRRRQRSENGNFQCVRCCFG
jgi:hypothetical protein